MARVFVSTVPFGEPNRLPLEILERSGIDYTLNPLGRRLTESELNVSIGDSEVLIAGTEPITRAIMDRAPKLKLISRVGVGLDNIDLHAARERGIQISYTPDAPAAAVSELTVALMIALLRNVHIANSKMHEGLWHRAMGRRLTDVTIGVIGAGRIGGRVLDHLSTFGSPVILANDLLPRDNIAPGLALEWVDKDTIYREAELLTLHVPLTRATKGMMGIRELQMMRPDALLINVARGGIVDEVALYEVLRDGHLAGAAIDVFSEEPYSGPLSQIERCLLTCHMGSMSSDCRGRMEIEATEEACRFFLGEDLQGLIPDDEYQARL